MARALAIALALAGAHARLFHETVARPSAWTLAPDLELTGAEPITLQFALRPATSHATLERTLLAVSTPGSPSYRKFLSLDELSTVVAPAAPDVARVVDWLRSALPAATVDVTLNADWAVATTTVAEVEALLETKLGVMVCAVRDQRVFHALSSYSIPDPVADIVQFVAGLHTYERDARRPARAPSATAKAVDPATLDALYALPNASAAPAGSQAVVQFGDNFSPDDLQTFFETFRPDLVGETVSVIGENDPSGEILGEANLDTQYVTAVGQNIATTDYGLSLDSDPAGMLQWAWMVGNDTAAPLVHSISYGEYGGSYDNATVQRLNYELMKLGLRGITVTLASGDNGVGCSARTLCGLHSDIAQEFDFPSSPYITMVGATQLGADGVESGATLSSGGFSRDYPRAQFAAWQADAVDAYVDALGASGGPAAPAETFFAAGRAYPDVAAIGENVQVVIGGRVEGIAGTSCSSPMFAGMVAQLNAELIAAGKPTMGWINPWIYAHADMFTDVTTGSNPYGCCDGFEAATGWDPVTGMGTPIYSKMLEYALMME